MGGGCNFRAVRKALFGGMKFKQTLKGGEEAPQEDVGQRTFQAEGLPDAKSPWRARVMFASGTAKHVHGGSEASEAGSRQDPGEGARAESHRAREAAEETADLSLNEGQAIGGLNGVIFS